MSISLPNGAVIAIASGYAASAAITAISNKKPAVATAANTLAAGDFIELTSGWSRLTDRIVRALAPVAASFSMEGVDTTNETVYPSGAGAGAFRKITGWTQLSQILSSNSSGGEQQYLDYQFLESDTQKSIPTFKTAARLVFSVADDPSQPGYILAAEANEDRLPRAVRITLPGGAVLLYNAYISLNKTPKLATNDIMSIDITLALVSEPMRY